MKTATSLLGFSLENYSGNYALYLDEYTGEYVTLERRAHGWHEVGKVYQNRALAYKQWRALVTTL